MNILPVIMAGGHGTRLWPLSRANYPKQFIKIFDSKSLYQLSLIRNKEFGKPVVIVGVDHRFIAQEQAAEIGIEVDIIVEPVAKNTAPCALIAAYLIKEAADKAVILLPADHFIANHADYIKDINHAVLLLNNSDVATIGITPSSPNTGYGYIEKGEKIADQSFAVKRFVEKPDADRAQKYIDSGTFYWNSGIFLFKASMWDIAQELLPEMKNHIQKSFETSEKDLGFLRLGFKDYNQIIPDSIDYAIIEKIKSISLQEATFDWSDLGSFASIWEIENKDNMSNFCYGDSICLNGKNNYIYSSAKLALVSGLDNLVVINTPDALLVTSIDKSEEIKSAVKSLSVKGRKEVEYSSTSYRPWGSYEIIDSGQRHKVKRIVVHPGKKLSLQYHHKRSEHWVVVEGVAEVQVGEEIRILHENDSVYIPMLVKHRLNNIGEVPLHLIEVQTGSYLGEDDIVRISDIYGRK